MKKILSLLVLSLVLVSCSKKPEELLVGKWALSSEPDKLYIEFYEDGTFLNSSGNHGEWSILDGPKLKMVDNYFQVFEDLKVSENEMTYLKKSGHLDKYVRVN
jgi:hypothetical protein